MFAYGFAQGRAVESDSCFHDDETRTLGVNTEPFFDAFVAFLRVISLVRSFGAVKTRYVLLW